MDTSLNQTAIALDDQALSNSSPRPERGFWSLIVTQFQGAYSDNILRNLLLSMIVGMGLSRNERETFVSVVTFLFSVPFILLSMPGGWLADHFSKRQITIWTKVMELGSMAVATAGLAMHSLTLSLVALTLVASQAALFGPSKYGLLPELLPAKRLSWGNGVIELGTFLAIIIGTVTGATLAERLHGHEVYAGYVLLGLALVGLLTSLGIDKVPAAAPTKQFRFNIAGDLWRQIKVMHNDRPLFLAVAGNTYFWFLGSLLFSTIVVYGPDVLHIGQTRTGYLNATLALGIGIGSMAAGYLSGNKIEYGLIPLGSIGMTITGLILGATPHGLIGSAVLLGLLGFFAGFFAVPVNALIQHRPAEKDKGGIIAAANLLSFVGIALSAGVYYIFTTYIHLDPRGVIVAASFITAAGTIYVLMLLPEWFGRLILFFITHTIYHVRVIGRDNFPEKTVTEVPLVIPSAMDTAAAKPIGAEPPLRIIPQVPPLLVQAPAIPPPPVAVKPVSLALDQLSEAPASASHPATSPIPKLVTAHQFREESRKNSVESVSTAIPPDAVQSYKEAGVPYSFQAAAPSFTSDPPRKTFADRLRSTLPFEELLGMNLFAKIGIILLVLGFALLGRMALIAMGPGQRVSLIYAASALLLGGGVWLEMRERYRLIGRAGIGGGWALFFFTTYAMHHVSAMAVLASNTLDCVLMLLVAISMVAHTIRYKSQVVTGLAFLLAFSTVALSQDSVYALVAGVILALGIVAIGLRMNWYELEVFGILASYANHFYWLYKLYPNGFAGHAFPQFWTSSIILLLYWAVFRVSYIVRTIRSPRDETISSLAALLNTMSLLVLMKFQSTRPELAFYALLALGAVEFFCGQLPPCRRRHNAFKLLTIVGTILMFASVPFRFSGNSIAFFWMIAAELLLIAGIIQAEVVFRRLGLIAGTLTGLLVIYEARSIIELRQHSESLLTRDGILLLTVSLLFCINAQFIRRKWDEKFVSIDGPLATVQGYLGAVTAVFGVWAIFTADWTALGWAALFLAAATGKRRLNDNHLMVQAWALAALLLFRCQAINCHFDIQYPDHIAARFITLPILAVAFYTAAWLLSGVDDMRIHLRMFSVWAGSILLAVLAWLDITQPWVYAFDDENQRARWSNFPTGFIPRGGINLRGMTPIQRNAAMNLLAVTLSERGYEKVQQIMEGDEVNKIEEAKNGNRGPGGPGGGGPPRGNGGPPPGAGGPPPNGGGNRPPGGGPGLSADLFGKDLYYISFLGTPSEKTPWMLQFGGHHLALNITIAGDQGVLTPTLTGAQPALYNSNGKTVRPLGRESDKALALLNALDEGERKQAVLSYKLADLVLGPGQDGVILQPEGLKASAMNDKQRAMLLDVISEWAGIINDTAAAARMAQLKADLNETYFSWSGPTDGTPGKNISAYYRIQGPHLVIEYAPQTLGGDASLHVHTMYRDPTNDYGRGITKK